MRNLFLLFFIPFIFGCKEDPKITPVLPADNLQEIIPEGWPQPKYTFSVNTISQDKFILGRSLFYENMLSADNSISCGSCHQNFAAFANADHTTSHGVNGQFGKRNAPGIFNAVWHPAFMHDGGINNIEVQPLGPISNPIEMAENINNVIQKLQASEKYKALFTKAYGNDEVTSQKMLRAMAQFMGLMYSYNSKYDQYKRQENNVEFTAQELSGYSLFLSKCSACHKEPLFSDFQYRNNGLAVNPAYNDSGRAHITALPQDRYKFKTPSLRNIAKTGPYMHDGRYATLEDCLDHYTNNITNMVNIDPLLQTGSIPLTDQDKKDIIVFLNTLTDYKFINDKRFADPNFK
ncbi:MAG: cytochrome-c peroxidase [Bacteroidia bacterium]